MAVNIDINGDGLTYKAVTSILKASQIIAFLSADTDPSSVNANYNQSSPILLKNKNNNQSPREALNDSGAKTNMQKILVLAKYHLDRTGNISFKPLEIKAYFKKAGEPEPRNFSRDIKDAIGLGYIYEDMDGNRDYVITDYGNDLLKSGFQTEAKKAIGRKKTSSAKKTSSKKASVAKASPSVLKLEIVPKLEGVISYHDVSTKSDKILWILYSAYKNSITELSSSDIEYIAEKLVDNVPASSHSALTEKSRKLAYVTKTNDGKFKLLHDGIEHVKGLINGVQHGEHIQAVEGK